MLAKNLKKSPKPRTRFQILYMVIKVFGVYYWGFQQLPTWGDDKRARREVRERRKDPKRRRAAEERSKHGAGRVTLNGERTQ